MRASLQTLRQLGVVDAALLALARLLEVVTRDRVRLLKYYFMAQPVPREPKPMARASGISVEEMRAGDPRFDQFERPAGELARRFATSSRCLAAWQGATLAGFLWFTDGEYAEDEVRCRFRVDASEPAVWDFDVHIVPRFRLGRTFARLWEHAFAAMRAQGARWTLSRVSAFKPESIRAHQRLGARRTGWAIFLLSGSYQLTLTSLGHVKGRRLEHGVYPVMAIRPPGGAEPTDGKRPLEESERLESAPAGAAGGLSEQR